MIRTTSRSKYHNKKVTWNGVTYDSKKECKRHQELLLLQRAGAIRGLERQVPFELIPSQRDPETGKVIERACVYVADFTYYDDAGRYIVEDAKGFRTPEYKIKRKLLLKVHGIRIKEV